MHHGGAGTTQWRSGSKRRGGRVDVAIDPTRLDVS
jgi:hypothetical protein